MSINPNAVSALVERARRTVEEGLLPAAQIALAREGELLLAETFGDADNDTRFHVYSAAKPTVALTAMELAAAGRFDITAPVSDVLASFGANGKDAITVSQVLLHAGGFPYAQLNRAEITDRKARLDAYASWQTDWQPGTRFEYHATSAHWVLADVIAEVSGRPYAEEIAARVLEPVECSSWFAIDPTEQSDIADVVLVGVETSKAELEALGWDKLPGLVDLEQHITSFNLGWMRAAGVPGGGGMASACDLALWYQAVLHNTGEFLHPRVRQDAMQVRQRYPDWLGTPANRSRAFILAGDDGKAGMRGFGNAASAGAFGHGGVKGQIGWADPASGLSFAFLTNGLDRNEMSVARRVVGMSSAALACTA